MIMLRLAPGALRALRFGSAALLVLFLACAVFPQEQAAPRQEEPARPVEEPALAWATYLGVEGRTGAAFNVAVDSTGNAVVAGSVGFPAMGGAPDDRPADGFVAKVSPSGQVLWFRILGGSGFDSCRAVALDKNDNAYVVGSTRSGDFPTPGGFDTTLGGAEDGFVVEVSPEGEIAWGTYIGGSAEGLGSDYVSGIAVDKNGSIWISGGTASADFPAPQETRALSGKSDVFVAKISPDKKYERAWLYGGEKDERAGRLALDRDGGIWFLCNIQHEGRDPSAFAAVRVQSVVRFSAEDGSWKKYDRQPNAFYTSIECDEDGNVLAAGTIRTPSLVPICGVALKLTPDGTPVWKSDIRRTLRGDGSFLQECRNLSALCFDARGRLWVAGDGDRSESAGAAGTLGMITGGGDAFLAILGEDGHPLWQSFLGGSRSDHAYAIAADRDGGIYVVGETFSEDFPTPGAHDARFDGSAEAFIARVVYSPQKTE